MGVKVKPLAPGDMVLRKVVSIAWNPSWENQDLTGKVHIASLW